MPMYTKWEDNKEKLEEAVKESKSVAGVCRKLGLLAKGGNFHTMKLWIARHDIDCSHFTGQGWNKDNFYDLSALRCMSSIKENLIRTRGSFCEYCNRDTWYDSPISLELHHVDGDRTNNTENNLQLLCPNCHSYTDNWRGKKNPR